MKYLTREEIVELVTKITDVDHYTEEQIDQFLEELQNGVLDPNISDYIFWDDLTPEKIADKALAYRPICL